MFEGTLTDVDHPRDLRPVVALFCTRGMETFLSNALQGILAVGIDPGQIRVGCPTNAVDTVSGVTRRHAHQIQIITNQTLSENDASVEGYTEFGSRSFKQISWRKIFLIRQLIDCHPHVIYADLDVAWIRNPLPYLAQVAQLYPMAFQTEGLPRFPPALCTGFAAFVRSQKAIGFLDALIEFDAGQKTAGDRLADQAACQRLVEADVSWLQAIYCLPEALFLNGLGYRSLQNNGISPCPMEGEASPFLFHANWTVGIENKRKLLASTGTWLLGKPSPTDQPIIDRSPATESPPAIEASAVPALLLTVVFPVFDVRGDPAERIRPWIEKQDLDPRRYRIFVVASAETNLDEVSLRKILRPVDVILRIPGRGRDADYWNAGADAAETPWIFFVEAHGCPQPDSLSALAAWIEANPSGEACDFTIVNLDHHRAARLLKRWFAETHASWADPTTWRRIHRTAFAIRRDVFAKAGPFEPEYGQFAAPLFSARLHQHGFTISPVPASRIVHDDSLEISSHHDDTADYVRGEMDARAASDPEFFEKYFGPAPFQNASMIVPARYARSLIRALVAAARYRPAKAYHLLGQAVALLPAASLGVRDRARMLAAVTRVDEWLLMHTPLPEAARWTRFLLAHRRLVRTEQMRWMTRHPPLPLQVTAAEQRWPATTIGQNAILGLHALEHLGQTPFRWSRPVVLLRLAPAARGTLILETRNLRPIGRSDIIAVVAGRILSPEDIEFDGAGNIKLKIEPPSVPDAVTDIVMIASELREPSVEARHGRRLGLPLFSVGFHCEGSSPANSRSLPRHDGLRREASGFEAIPKRPPTLNP